MAANAFMKLLICTQAIDAKDSDLGFFVRWIEEFAKHCEKITVICLREGEHELPNNIEVIVVGKTRVWRAFNLLYLCISRRQQYDAVFVHMNPEYVVVAGLLWRLMNKKIALWYTHKSVDLKLRIAALFAHIVFTASRASFRLRTGKLSVMGHGIDTDFFSPDASIARGDWWLTAGRLNKSKRHDLAIRIAAQADKELRIVGEGPERKHLEALASEFGASVRFLGALTQSQLRDEYRKAALLVHTSETGSLDKVVLEALACGLPVRTNDPSLKALENASPAYVSEHHSLQRLIPRILQKLLDDDSRPNPKEFYDEVMPGKLGESYEDARWKKNALLSAQYEMAAEAIRRYILPETKRVAHILEVGPGPGTWTKLLLGANSEAQYTLVDISEKMLGQAREALASRANITFVESDFLAFESPQLFDFFFSSRAIEYMPDKAAVASKISSLLTRGARGAVVTKTPKPLFNRLRSRGVADLHKGQIAPRELVKLLQSAGLEVIGVYTATTTVPIISSAFLNRALFRMIRRLPLFYPLTLLTESYCVIFKKP